MGLHFKRDRDQLEAPTVIRLGANMIWKEKLLDLGLLSVEKITICTIVQLSNNGF